MVQSVGEPGGGFDYKANLGALLHVEVLSVETGINTSLGVKDAVRANITTLDGATPGQTTADALVFPRVLQGQLKGHVGQTLVGRLGQGVAKPGQNAPWVLQPATDEEVALAQSYEAHRAAKAGPRSVQPEPEAAAPAATPATGPRWD